MAKLTRKGECNRCGKCCSLTHLWKILKPKDREDVKSQVIQRLEHIARQHGVFGLNVRKHLENLRNDFERYLELEKVVFCPYLRKDKNGKFSCTIYEQRFWYCRAFPEKSEDIKDIPECGYYFE